LAHLHDSTFPPARFKGSLRAYRVAIATSILLLAFQINSFVACRPQFAEANPAAPSCFIQRAGQWCWVKEGGLWWLRRPTPSVVWNGLNTQRETFISRSAGSSTSNDEFFASRAWPASAAFRVNHRSEGAALLRKKHSRRKPPSFS